MSIVIDENLIDPIWKDVIFCANLTYILAIHSNKLIILTNKDKDKFKIKSVNEKMNNLFIE